MRTASLPMYDLPELRSAHDRLWAALAGALHDEGFRDLPRALIHDRPVRTLWSDPRLFFSQCCGHDVVDRYRDRLRPVATPEFDARGCRDECYCSLVVVAENSPWRDIGEMKGTVGVINGPESHSGMSALRHLIALCHGGGLFFSEIRVSGSHVASLAMIREGGADVGAVDSVTWTLLERHRPGALAGLRVLGTTYRAPAPPYVVPADMPEADIASVRRALARVFADPALADTRTALLLRGVTMSERRDYWVMEAFRSHALERGFPMLGQGA